MSGKFIETVHCGGSDEEKYFIYFKKHIYIPVPKLISKYCSEYIPQS